MISTPQPKAKTVHPLTRFVTIEAIALRRGKVLPGKRIRRVTNQKQQPLHSRSA